MARVSGVLRWFNILPLLALLFISLNLQVSAQQKTSLELSRPVRSWEFLPVLGTKAALFGKESGRMEAWVYPLKVLREFHVIFHVNGRALPAESLARTLTVRPESSTISYSSDTFSVRETFFVPVQEQGAVVRFEVQTSEGMEIEVAFERDLQLEWPAGLGATFGSWNPKLNGFSFGEEQKKYAAVVGSPTAGDPQEEYGDNYSEAHQSSFRLGVIEKGRGEKLVVIAGSVNGAAEAEATYARLSGSWRQLLKSSADYYRDYLSRTVSLDLPDNRLQTAYDWSRVSMAQGVVTNPYLGTGLVAGYRTSNGTQRPGFAWFFGRDSVWTSFALNASGDFSTTRAALDFVSRFQREDGKVPHEIAQTASLVSWFTNYPYGFASADATPLFIIGTEDYVRHSGDVGFVTEKWDNLWRAYQFLKSTYDEQGFPRNFGVGHGWIEGGPLLPVETELYQTGLGAQALKALASLAHLAGKEEVVPDLEKAYSQKRAQLNQAFWSDEKKNFGYALDTAGKRIDSPSVLTTAPMWFDVLDAAKVEPTLNQLADWDHQTDWGMRIVSSRNPLYDPGGYHFGVVWPLFTGWASVAEYRYHRPLAAYTNLRSNSLLAFEGSLGHVTEVLSGDYFESLSTSSPHQIWSAAMVVSPMLRGMMGLDADALHHVLRFAPHAPADWTRFRVSNVQVGKVSLNLDYSKSPEGILLKVERQGSGECELDFSPGFSLHAKLGGAEADGKKLASHVDGNEFDQHVSVRVPITSAATTIRIHSRGDFGVSLANELPLLGRASEGLRITREEWSAKKDVLALTVSGLPDHDYELAVWQPELITSVQGAEMTKNEAAATVAKIRFRAGPSQEYVQQTVTFHLGEKR